MGVYCSWSSSLASLTGSWTSVGAVPRWWSAGCREGFGSLLVGASSASSVVCSSGVPRFKFVGGISGFGRVGSLVGRFGIGGGDECELAMELVVCAVGRRRRRGCGLGPPGQDGQALGLWGADAEDPHHLALRQRPTVARGLGVAV